MTSAGVVKRHSLFAPLRETGVGCQPQAAATHRNVHATQGKKLEEKRARAYLVLNLLTHRERHFLDKDAANPVQFHRLTPIIESARDEHLVRIVWPTHQCEEPSSQRSNSYYCLCHGMSRALPVRQILASAQLRREVERRAPAGGPRGRGGEIELTIGM